VLNQSQTRVIDPILSNVVLGYRNGQLIGDKLFPRVPVGVSGGTIIRFGKEAFQTGNYKRAPGAATKRVDYGYAGDKYALAEEALEAKVPRERLRDASKVPGIDIASGAVKLVMAKLLLSTELEQATLAITAGNYDNNHKVALAGTDKWSDPASKPSVQIRTYREAVRSSAGVYPNTLILGAQAFNALAENPSILDKTKYTSKDSITPAILAALWELDEVVIGEAVQSDDAGTMTDVWGNNAVLAYVAKASTTIEEPSYGYTYVMEGHPIVEMPYWDNNTKSWIYGVTYERAPLLTSITSGFLIQTPN
jgi:hypothetical protein